MIDAQLEGNIRRHEGLEALYRMAVELSALRSLASVLNTALQHCLDLTDAQFGFVGLTKDDGKPWTWSPSRAATRRLVFTNTTI